MRSCSSLLLLAIPLFPALLAGCNFDFHLGESTRGALDKVDFAYSGSECFLGCKVDRAMMLGTKEQIEVTGKALPADLQISLPTSNVISTSFTRSQLCCISSGDGEGCGEIAPGAACSGKVENTFTITVSALGVGTAPVEVRDASGLLLDLVMVEVKKPTALTVASAAEATSGAVQGGPVDQIALGHGQRCDLAVQALDEAGLPLLASSGFTIAIADPKVGVLRESSFLFELTDPTKSEVLTGSGGTLFASASGATELEVAGGSLERKVPVEVK